LEYINNPRNEVEGQTLINSRNFFIPVDEDKYRNTGLLENVDSIPFVNRVDLRFAPNKQYITKDDLAVMDIIASNFYDRPIYFATTCKNDKLLGLNDYMQLEGLALRLTPIRTPSDQSMFIYGSGRAEVDLLYDNIMNKWKWGNFDKEDLFVDRNYMAEVQAMKMAMLRTGAVYAQRGNKERAGAVIKKYFESFPHMNFAYDSSVIPFINILVSVGEFDEAKKHMRILANESDQYMRFYESLDNDDFVSFQQDMSYTLRGISDILNLAQNVQDPAFNNEMKELLSSYTNTQQVE